MNKNKCLNTAMTKCFWCGEDTGIAIGEKLVDCEDQWKSKYIFGGYEPCDKCKEDFAKGFTLLEAVTEPVQEGQPHIQQTEDGVKVYPTGRLWVITNEKAEELFGKEKTKYGTAFIEPDFAEVLGLTKTENGKSDEQD